MTSTPMRRTSASPIPGGTMTLPKKLLATCAALLGVGALALVTSAPAHAITNGTTDGGAHPYVGGLVADQAYSDGTWIYCSGTLVSATVFITAAHCGEGDRVRVTFDTAYADGDATYEGTFHADPLYSGIRNNEHDIAVVVLDEAPGITPAQLPGAGSLSKLSKDQKFTSVGYGANEVTQGHGKHQFLYDDVRRVSTGTLNAVNPAWLRISMNPSTGNGGTCFGDSGGPNFLGNSDVLAAITNSGDAICRSTNVDYRLDTAAARAFLSGYVALP
ncbi:MAG: S1 family peptidase [Marmoricola sp.]